jgi:hypothetical protein
VQQPLESANESVRYGPHPCQKQSTAFTQPRAPALPTPSLADAAPAHLQRLHHARPLLGRRPGRAARQPLDERRHDARGDAAYVPHARQIAAHEPKRARRLVAQVKVRAAVQQGL